MPLPKRQPKASRRGAAKRRSSSKSSQSVQSALGSGDAEQLDINCEARESRSGAGQEVGVWLAGGQLGRRWTVKSRLGKVAGHRLLV